ncbi:tetratricopeptide repeat protein [Silvimonas iriomotensis]|uniref:Tetratricopeptide repeat protein n=1 Tax=Silvimonas iriomotensis TaxID=449662 RepID=A0ABQ2P5A2_9NEIS|nr:tetratricopeptide repeat protein [Silvimonas iriomotensis]GGP18410.1 hypothetical protein GCM10010970_04810 [Silvimonas iriomotensis]
MRWIASLIFAVATTLAFALPTEQDVQAAVKQGNFAQAQTMMAEVIAAKPDSAKAHYIYAEILAHNGQFADATNEALKAKTIDPQIHFTSPEKFRKFEAQLLNSAQPATTAGNSRAVTSQAVAPQPAPAERSSGFGWTGIILLVVAGFGILIWLTTRRREPAVFTGNGGPAQPYGVPGGYNNGVPVGSGPVVVNQGGSGLGAGLMGAAGGFAAGMLVEEMLDHRNGGLGSRPEIVENNTYIYENGASAGNVDQQLQNQSIDFGNGNSWDDNSGGGGDFSDSALDIGSDDNNW